MWQSLRSRGGLGSVAWRGGSEGTRGVRRVMRPSGGGLSGAKRQKRHFSVKTSPLGLEVGRATRSVHRAACMAAGGAGRGLRRAGRAHDIAYLDLLAEYRRQNTYVLHPYQTLSRSHFS